MEFPPINYSEKEWENLYKVISELGPDFFTTSTSDEPDEDLEEEQK